MATIVRKSLIYSEPQPFGTGKATIPVGPFQPFVFVSLAGLAGNAPPAPPFPAVVDTGYGGVFCMRWEHMRDYVGLSDPVAHELLLGTRISGGQSRSRVRIVSRGAVCTIQVNLLVWDRKDILETKRAEYHPGRRHLLTLDQGIDLFLPPQIALAFAHEPALVEKLKSLQLQSDHRPQCPLLGVRALREHHLRLITSGHWFSLVEHGPFNRWLDFRQGLLNSQVHSG